jgi:hypothetical protein
VHLRTNESHHDLPGTELAPSENHLVALQPLADEGSEQYLSAEYEGREGIGGEAPLSRRGWGHGTVEACVVTAVAAGVRALHVGHREPQRTDEQTAAMEQRLQNLLAEELRRAGRGADECSALIAYEGLSVRL